MPIFKQQKFPTTLLIVAAFLSLIAVPVLFLFLHMAIFPVESLDTNNVFGSRPAPDSSDPFITKIPSIKDMIKEPVISNNDPIIGKKDAPVIIVEYSDFRCEFCQKQEAILKKIVDEYNGKVALMWKDYPEDGQFSDTWLANIAGRCAQEQGKFWEMHGTLFENANNVSQEKFSELAASAGMDKEKFAACLNDTSPRNLIKNNITEANALEITGVPFIYVNKQEVMGEISYEDLKKMIDAELKK